MVKRKSFQRNIYCTEIHWDIILFYFLRLLYDNRTCDILYFGSWPWTMTMTALNVCGRNSNDDDVKILLTYIAMQPFKKIAFSNKLVMNNKYSHVALVHLWILKRYVIAFPTHGYQYTIISLVISFHRRAVYFL